MSIHPFVLKDQYGKDFVSTAHPEQWMLLSFHPLAWTGVCTEQMKRLEVLYSRWEQIGVIPVGISVDSVPCKKAWSESMGLQKLRILSDFWPHGNVATLFEIFRSKEGFSERCNIMLSKEKVILWKKVYPISELPDFEEIFSWWKEQVG